MTSGEASGGPRPRVGLVAVDDGLYSHRWAESLLADPRIVPVFVSCLSPFHAPSFNPGASRGRWAVLCSRLAYYGCFDTFRFAVRLGWSRAQDLLARQLGIGRTRSIRSFAEKKKVPIIDPPGSDINDGPYVQAIRQEQVDLLVCSYSQKASPLFLSAPTRGCLNVHFSLLPRHAGREPSFRALLSGEGAGVTVHWMTEGVDEGPVVYQEGVGMQGLSSLHQLIMRCCEAAARAVPAAVLAATYPPAGAGPRGNDRINSWPSAEEIARFRARGFRFA